MVVSGQDQIQKLNLFDGNATFDKIEIRDDNSRPVFSPKTGVNFHKGLNSVFDWNPEDSIRIQS